MQPTRGEVFLGAEAILTNASFCPPKLIISLTMSRAAASILSSSGAAMQPTLNFCLVRRPRPPPEIPSCGCGCNCNCECKSASTAGRARPQTARQYWYSSLSRARSCSTFLARFLLLPLLLRIPLGINTYESSASPSVSLFLLWGGRIASVVRSAAMERAEKGASASLPPAVRSPSVRRLPQPLCSYADIEAD